MAKRKTQQWRETGDEPTLDTIADIDPKTGRITYRDVASRKPKPGKIGGLDFLPQVLRRPIEDWAAEVPPIRRNDFGRLTGPGGLDALGTADIPFQAAGNAVFEATGSPAAATAGYIGSSIPGAVSRGARSVGRMGLEKLPGTLDSIATKMGTQLHAVKPRGGQWIEPDLRELLEWIPDEDLDEPYTEIGKYVDKNLRRWIKTDMGTTVTDDLARELGLAEGARNLFDSAIHGRPAKELIDGPYDHRKTLPWLTNVDPNTPIYNLGPDLPNELWLMMDYARTLPPESLKNRSVPDMLRQSKVWHDELARKKTEAAVKAGSLKSHREYPEGHSWQEIVAPEQRFTVENLPEGYSLQTLNLPSGPQYVVVKGGNKVPPVGRLDQQQALNDFSSNYNKNRLKEGLDAEDQMMGHCVGSYCDQVSQGGARIFSLRDKSGRPHVTVEVLPKMQDPVQDWFNSVGGADSPQAQEYLKALNAARKADKSVTAKTFFPQWAEQQGFEPNVRGESFDIHQIRGKGDKAPIDTYLPFVQDFVRNSPLGTPWGDVREAANAGLVKARDNVNPEIFEREAGRSADEWLTPDELTKLWGSDNWAQGKKKKFAAGGSVDLDPGAIEHLFALTLDD